MDQSLALFVVLAVNLIIWAAIAVYLWRLDAKVKELEKRGSCRAGAAPAASFCASGRQATGLPYITQMSDWRSDEDQAYLPHRGGDYPGRPDFRLYLFPGGLDSLRHCG
jgi:CcmD family protein